MKAYNYLYIIIVVLFLGFINCEAQQAQVFQYTTNDGLPQNSITNLLFDKNDRLWIGTNGGLCVFNGQNFSQITHSKLHPRILLLTKDHNSSIYAVDGIDNLYEGPLNQKKLIQLNKNETYVPWFFNDKYTAKFKNYSAHYRFLILFKLGYKNIKHFTKNGTTFLHDEIKNFDQNKEYFLVDSILVILKNNKSLSLHNTNGSSKIGKTKLPPNMLESGFIFQSDKATYCLYKQTIFKLKVKNDSLIAIPKLNNVPLDKIDHAIITGQYNANTGFFYFGSSKYGLYKVIPNSFEVLKHSTESQVPIINENVAAYYSQSEYYIKDDIFIGNYIRLNKNGQGSFNAVQDIYNRAFNYQDKNQNLWYSDHNKIIIEKKGSKKETITVEKLQRAITNICQYSDSTFFLSNPDYLIRMDHQKVSRTLSKEDIGIGSREFINYLYKPKHESCIFILTTSSIYKFSPTTEKCKKVDLMKDAEFRIMQDLIDGYQFVGTYGQGYYLHYNGKWTKMPLDKNGYLKFAHAALIDSLGYVWISSNNGLFQTKFEDMTDYAQGKNPELYYYYYDKSSGFLTDEFNGGCQTPALKLRDGRFSFSSMDGLVQFNPNKLQPLFPIHTFEIENVWLNGVPKTNFSNKLVLNQPLQELKMSVGTTFYGHPDNLIFEYKIEHLLGHWKRVTQDNHVVVQNLPRGHYEITIRKRTGFGKDAFEYKKVKIQVLPYFYQTWWFKTLLIAIGLLLSYLFSRWYNGYTIQQNKDLETLVAEKNEGLVQTNKTLNEKIKQNDLFQSILVHDIKSPLRFIASSTKILLDHWPSIHDDIKKENLLHIHESASKIQNFVEETLLWIHIRNGEHQPEPISFNVHDLLVENAILYNEDPKIVTKKIMVHVMCDPRITICSDRSLISTIIRNLFTNSIKYTDQGKITLYAYTQANGKLCIGCKDEGRGLSNVMVEAILSDDYKGNTIQKDSFRMGYVIIKEIVRLLDAKLIIKSANDQGSDVCLEFITL